MTRYTFPQAPSIVPGELAAIFESFEKINVTPDHILDLYLVVHRVGRVPNDIRNPYRYTRKVLGLNIGVRYRELEQEFNNNYPKLWSTAPLDFLTAFDATYGCKANDSGLHNGMIYERFFSQVAADDRILIINPPLSFVSKLIDDPFPPQARIQLLFSNICYAEALQMDPRAKRFTPYCLEKMRYLRAHKVLFFAALQSEDYNKEVLSFLYEKISRDYDPTLFVLLPTAYMDRREPENLRNYIGERYSINFIALIPAKAANIPPQKRCMLVMHRGPNRHSKVILQNTRCEGKNAVTGLTSLSTCKITHDLLMQSSASLHSLYNQALAEKNSSGKRKKAEVYRISAELSIGYSVSPVNGKYRGKYTLYGPPTSRQLRENHAGRGTALCKAFSGKLYSTHNVLVEDIERFCFHSPIIRAAIKTLSVLKPCSLKTFWYMHQDELLADARYDGKILEEIFLVPQSWNSELCAVNVCSDDPSSIRSAIDAVAQSLSMSDTRKRNFTKQLEIVYDLVRKVYPDAPSNPITPIFSELMERPDALHTMRDNLVRRSWSHDEEKRLLNILNTDEQSPVLALGALIRFYTGISVREACALVWEDYQRIPGFDIHTLMIRRTFKGNSTVPKPLATKDLYRSIPVCQPLELALSRHKSDFAKTCSAKELDPLPILSSSGDPVRPEVLIAYERQLFEALNLPELRLHVPSEKDPVEVDINDYLGDWLRSNFRFHVQFDGHMDTDEMRYCLGVRPVTTAAQHYSSSLKPTSQLRMCCAINRWTATHRLPTTANTKLQTLHLHKNTCSISSTPAQYPSEFVLDICTSEADHNSTLELSVLARYGMGIVIEEITKEVDPQ